MAGGTLGVVAFAAVGGVLFGLDQGNWGGAIVKEGFIEAFCSGTAAECHDASLLPEDYAQFLSLGSSLLQLGAAIGAVVVAPHCAKEYGRREAMFLGSVVTVAGCLPQALLVEIPHFLAARLLAGVGVGIVTYALPMFVSEIAPAELRGVLGCFMQLTMVGGTVVASVLNCQPWFQYQYSFAMPAVPAAIVALGIFFFPTSPRFALVRGQRCGLPDGGAEAAWKALRVLRGSDAAADEELSLIMESLAEEETDTPWSTLWTVPSIRRRVIIANLLQWMQQLTGVNAILSYGPAIFQSAEVPLSSLACAVVTNTFNLVGTIFMMLIIDRLGRRSLLLFGAACMFVFMSLSAGLAHMLTSMGEDDPSKNALGWCLLACVCLYMASFAIAWGGVPWVYPSEIFPMSVKERAMSTSVCSQWTANFLIAYVVPQQVQTLQVSGTFVFYAACLALNFGLVYELVPETKGLELEEMGKLFGEVDSPVAAPLMPRQVSKGSAACVLGMGGKVSTMPELMSLLLDREQQQVQEEMPATRRRSLSESDANAAAEKKSRALSRVFMAPGGSVALF